MKILTKNSLLTFNNHFYNFVYRENNISVIDIIIFYRDSNYTKQI